MVEGILPPKHERVYLDAVLRERPDRRDARDRTTKHDRRH
jgi:hypothetical protein